MIDPASGRPYPAPEEVQDLQRQAEQGQRQAELAQRQVEARALNEEIARRDAEQACRDAVGIARSMVLKIVARRFGEVSDSFIARLAVIADPGHLDRLADSALAAPSLELFIQGLGDSDRP